MVHRLERLTYLGKPPSHVCSGSFCDFPEHFCREACASSPHFGGRHPPRAHACLGLRVHALATCIPVLFLEAGVRSGPGA